MKIRNRLNFQILFSILSFILLISYFYFQSSNLNEISNEIQEINEIQTIPIIIENQIQLEPIISIKHLKKSKYQIAVVSLYLESTTDRFSNFSKQFASVSIANKMNYCTQHALPFFFYHNSLAIHNRKIAWNKIIAIQHYLQAFDWLLWIDIDAFCKIYYYD